MAFWKYYDWYNTVHFPRIYIIHIIFNTNLLVQCFCLLVIAPKCFGLSCWPFNHTCTLSATSGCISWRRRKKKNQPAPWRWPTATVEGCRSNNYQTKALCNKLVLNIIYVLIDICGPGSSVGIETGYGLDGPGIESRCGRDFSHLSRPALGTTQPPVQSVPGLYRGKERPGRDADPSPLSSAVIKKE